MKSNKDYYLQYIARTKRLACSCGNDMNDVFSVTSWSSGLLVATSHKKNGIVVNFQGDTGADDLSKGYSCLGCGKKYFQKDIDFATLKVR